MTRDNFNKPIIVKIKARVSHRCSNPSCRVPTSAPSGNESVNNIGIAAHICAASPGGPRYDESMTIDERKSIDNAIWLCSNCSINIDRDQQKYTINLLKEWKEKAENSARVELGKKLPSKSETIDTVAAALTGYPKEFIINAISNVHNATGKAIESIDPRFLVKTSHGDGKTSVALHAKENISLSMKIDNKVANGFMEKHLQLVEHGKDVEISSKGITVEGSKLFQEMLDSQDGVISITSKKIKATQKMWLVDNNTNIVEQFDDILGAISFGTKSFTFNGTSCDNLFSLIYKKHLDGNSNKVNITMSLCLKQWEGVNLRLLPYFDKLLSLFTKMAQGWSIFTSLEINGTKVLVSEGIKVDDMDYILDISSFLNYTNRCKIISQAFQPEIQYTSNVSYTSEEHRNIVEITDIIENRQDYNISNITSNVTCELLVGDGCNSVKLLSESTEPCNIQFVQNAEEKVTLFGVEVILPNKIMYLESVSAKIHGDIGKLKKGNVVKVEWIPKKDFKCTIRYKS